MFLQTATGTTSSRTVTVLVQVEVLPALSVTVNVTTVEGASAQVKDVCDAAKGIAAKVQLSELPSLRSAAMRVGALRFTLTFLHTAVGGTLSTTVTVNEQVEELGTEAASVAVMVTVVVPKANVLPLGLVDAIDTTPVQLSVAVTIGQLAVASQVVAVVLTVKLDGQLVMTGAWLSDTMTLKAQVFVKPPASVAV
jgi:hypothetical protein